MTLCKNCRYFKPNGGVTSDGAVYRGYIQSRKLGKCECPVEPPYGRLKNEQNSCDNWVDVIAETT